MSIVKCALYVTSINKRYPPFPVAAVQACAIWQLKPAQRMSVGSHRHIVIYKD